MTKLIIEDNILTKEESYQIYESFFLSGQVPYNMWMDKGSEPAIVKKIIDHAGKYFDLSTAVGYEWWLHLNGSLPPKSWHYDLDEHYWIEHKVQKNPLCSTIYYPIISNVKGGEFETENVIIEPKSNRAIFMSPNTLHTVKPYTGNRFSLLINVWDYKLEWCHPTFFK